MIEVSKCTMREFIGLVLVAAVKIDDNKKISPQRYQRFHICVIEEKKLAQNIER